MPVDPAMASAAVLSPADQDALQAMLAVDSRADADANWLATGARVRLQGFERQEFNGQRAEVLGFDEASGRYRIKLDSDGRVVKALREKLVVDAPHTALAVQGFSNVPDRMVVQGQISAVRQNAQKLFYGCQEREKGAQNDLSQMFHVLILSSDAAEDILAMHESAYGRQELLQTQLQDSLDRSLEAQEWYEGLRLLGERLQDELWLFQHQRQRHGLLGMLRQEVADTCQDVQGLVADTCQDVQSLAADTTNIIRQSSTVVAEKAPHLARSATGAVGSGLQNTMQAARQAASSYADKASQNTFQAMRDKVVTNVYAALRILGWGLFLCCVIPYFAVHSLAAILGVLWMAMCVFCPPQIRGRRCSRMGMLVVWPFLCLGAPQLLRYMLQNPQLGPYAAAALRQAGRAAMSIRHVVKYLPPRLQAVVGGVDVTGAPQSKVPGRSNAVPTFALARRGHRLRSVHRRSLRGMHPVAAQLTPEAGQDF
mmetsp:Transcript_61939/g.114964  ORF Transcript_61939/g.114964 Transcript_61939/m.114964 type:complete len:483 (-) Transcript_61939:54-1502(-)